MCADAAQMRLTGGISRLMCVFVCVEVEGAGEAASLRPDRRATEKLLVFMHTYIINIRKRLINSFGFLIKLRTDCCQLSH